MIRRRHLLRLPTMALAAALALSAAGCGSMSPLAAWAHQLEQRRAEARAHLDRGEREQAVALLRDAVALRPPSPDARTAGLQQDAHFALGRALLEGGDHAGALAQAEAGLALAPDAETVFAANLHALSALSLEALGRDADALPSYERALGIHKALFDRTLEASQEAGT